MPSTFHWLHRRQLQIKQAVSRGVKKVFTYKVVKIVQKTGWLILCLAVLSLGLLFSALPPVGAQSTNAPSQTSQSGGLQIQGVPIRPVATAVVNFDELARQEALRPATSGRKREQVIHAPLTMTEPDSPPSAPAPALIQTPASPQVASPTPSATFLAQDDIAKVGTSTIVIPPDTMGAVGTDAVNKVFVTVNNNYRTQNKTTGATITTVSMDTFWAGVGGSSGPFDPRIQYDRYNDRWLVACVSNVSSAGSSILVGISAGSDPGGSYTLFRFDADSGDTLWADFPMLGFNKNWFVVTVNMFTIAGDVSTEERALVLDYPTLRGGTATSTYFTAITTGGFCMHPATTYSSTESTEYLVSHISSGGATYKLSTITGTPPAAPVLTIPAGTKVNPLGAWAPVSGDILPQTCTAPCVTTTAKIDAGDQFIRGNVVFRNTNIWYSQTIGLPSGGLTHTALQWVRLNTAGDFIDGGRVDDSTATDTNGGKWYAYSTITTNSAGETLLGFSQFSSAQAPAAGYTYRSPLDTAGTMRDPNIFRAGDGYYEKRFGGTRNRWGDYSHTMVDPTDDQTLWTIQEYAATPVGTSPLDGTGRWATQWAKLTHQPTAAPATISGTVTTPDGAPLAGVTMRLSGARLATAIADSNGNYRFDNVDTDNFYTVTPSLANYHFSPGNRSFSLLADKGDAVFTAVPEAVVSVNAIDTNEYFVRQQYLDFLGREPDQNGFEYWNNELNRCNGDADCLHQRRIDVSAAFFDSPEFQETGSFVYRLYRGALGRQLRFGEFSADRRQVVAGPNLDRNKAAFADAFVERREFVARYANSTTAETFVDALLQTMRDADGVDLSSERDNLIRRYNAGQTMSESRSLVVRDVGDNAAFTRAVYNQAFVLMEYFGYLQRDPDRDGYDFWLNALNNEPGNYRGMVCSFITSTEYQRRFSSVVTRGNAECSGVR